MKLKKSNLLHLEDFDDQQHAMFSRAAVYGIVGAILLCASIGLIIVGVKLGRVKPQIVDLQIIGQTQMVMDPRLHEPKAVPTVMLHLGSHIVINEIAHLPGSCIVQTRRYIVLDSVDGKKPEVDLLPSDSLPDDFPFVLPIPLQDKTGCGAYREDKSTQGCGWFIGIIAPDVTSSKPVRVCVLPAQDAVTK